MITPFAEVRQNKYLPLLYLFCKVVQTRVEDIDGQAVAIVHCLSVCPFVKIKAPIVLSVPNTCKRVYQTVVYVRSAMARKINSDTNCIVTLLNSLSVCAHVMLLACVISDLGAVRCSGIEPFHTNEFYVALKGVRVKSVLVQRLSYPGIK